VSKRQVVWQWATLLRLPCQFGGNLQCTSILAGQTPNLPIQNNRPITSIIPRNTTSNAISTTTSTNDGDDDDSCNMCAWQLSFNFYQKRELLIRID